MVWHINTSLQNRLPLVASVKYLLVSSSSMGHGIFSEQIAMVGEPLALKHFHLTNHAFTMHQTELTSLALGLCLSSSTLWPPTSDF
jgi:hypothetical protein